MTWPEFALTVLGAAIAVVAGGGVTLQLAFLVGRAITRRLPDPELQTRGVIQKFAGFDEQLYLRARRRDVDRELKQLLVQRRHLDRVLSCSSERVVRLQRPPRPSAVRKTGT